MITLKRTMEKQKRANPETREALMITLFLFPVLLWCAFVTWPEFFQWLPQRELQVLSSLKHFVFPALAMCALVYYGFGESLDIQKKRYAEQTLADFSLPFERFLIQLFLKAGDLTGQYTERKAEWAEDYKDFGSVVLGSVDGERVDYFSVDFSEPRCPSIKVFYVGKWITKRRACRLLSEQGFMFDNKKEGILCFKKDELSLFLYPSKLRFGFQAIEVKRENAKMVSAETSLITQESLFFADISAAKKKISSFPFRKKLCIVLLGLVVLAAILAFIVLVVPRLDNTAAEYIQKGVEAAQSAK